MGEFGSSGNVVPQQSLRSVSGISLAIWTVTLSYYVHCILKYKSTSYTLHPLLILTVKILFHGINFFRHSLHICSCIPHYQQVSCQVCLVPCPNTNAPRRLFPYISFCQYFVSFTDGSDMLICSIEPRNRICNDI
jgi:hypothetical protein